MVLPKLVHAEPKPNLRTMNLEAQTVEQVNGKFVLPDLPYRFEALEPWIDAETNYLHHDFHHKSFVTNLNTMFTNFRSGGTQRHRPRLQPRCIASGRANRGP